MGKNKSSNNPEHIATAEEHQEMMDAMHRIAEEERLSDVKMKAESLKDEGTYNKIKRV